MAKKVIKEGRVHFYVYITKKQRDALKIISDHKETTLSALMRDVLSDYIRTQIRIGKAPIPKDSFL